MSAAVSIFFFKLSLTGNVLNFLLPKTPTKPLSGFPSEMTTQSFGPVSPISPNSLPLSPSGFPPFLANAVKSPLSSPTWSSYSLCSNPKDALTLSNIDKYLSGALQQQQHHQMMMQQQQQQQQMQMQMHHNLQSSPVPSLTSPEINRTGGYRNFGGSVSSPGSSDSSSIWEHVFSPIDGPGSHTRSSSPTDSDTSGISSTSASSGEPLAEGLSEMMVRMFFILFSEMNFEKTQFIAKKTSKFYHLSDCFMCLSHWSLFSFLFTASVGFFR